MNVFNFLKKKINFLKFGNYSNKERHNIDNILSYFPFNTSTLSNKTYYKIKILFKDGKEEILIYDSLEKREKTIKQLDNIVNLKII